MVFLDANVFVSAASDDPRSASCSALLSAIAYGHLKARTSVGVAEEVWHLQLSRPALRLFGAIDRLIELMHPLLPFDEAAMRTALALPATGVGAYDRIHAATCILNGIDTIVTADRAFDELDRPRRLDPVDAVAELLG